MNMTINKTRIRPSISVSPDRIHEEDDYGWRHKTNHYDMIDHEVCNLIRDHVILYNDVQAAIKTGNTALPVYDKQRFTLGGNYFKCAFVAGRLDRDYGKALYWLRKAWACFDFDGHLIIKDESNEDSYIWLTTDIIGDYDWKIAATVVTRSFLGKSETHTQIGVIKEEPDLTPVTIRVEAFNRYIGIEHDKYQAIR
jgi:hypothetical protein